MRQLMVTAFVSLDGVMQGPGGPDEDRDGGFDHGGWAVPSIDPQFIELAEELTSRAGALLLGRRTYEEFAATWPLAADDDPIGSRMNGLPKYVASRTISEVSWNNSTLLSGDLETAVRELKLGDGAEIQVHGSADLIQSLIAHDLVDEFRVSVFPVVVGSGKRLFGSGAIPAALELVDTIRTTTGVIVSTYARNGSLEYGAMGPETGNW